MARGGPNFVEKDVFESVLAEVPRVDGTEYQDVATAYGDMSRLIVAWLACTPSKRLQELYGELGWKSTCNVRQCKLAAKHWLAKYHPGRAFPIVDD
jgi:hypothetical protein